MPCDEMSTLQTPDHERKYIFWPSALVDLTETAGMRHMTVSDMSHHEMERWMAAYIAKFNELWATYLGPDGKPYLPAHIGETILKNGFSLLGHNIQGGALPSSSATVRRTSRAESDSSSSDDSSSDSDADPKHRRVSSKAAGKRKVKKEKKEKGGGKKRLAGGVGKRSAKNKQDGPDGLCYRWARQQVAGGKGCTRGKRDCQYTHEWEEKWWQRWAK